MKIEIHGPSNDGQYWWRVVSTNGQVLLTSEMYVQKSSARRAARIFLRSIANGRLDGIEDCTN